MALNAAAAAVAAAAVDVVVFVAGFILRNERQEQVIRVRLNFDDIDCCRKATISTVKTTIWTRSMARHRGNAPNQCSSRDS